jgi:protein gp37
MLLTKIRWAGFTWNFFTGCTEISPGCDRCYARVVAENKKFASGFPNGFAPTYKPHKLREPYRVKEPQFCFVNSMSDFCHKAFTDEQRDAAMETMLAVDRHIYLILTKRAQALVRYVHGWLRRKGLNRVPSHIWFGVSIESDTYRHRADFLREVPGVRFISAEPLIAPLSRLNLAGIHWLIVGGESGNGSNDFRPMEHGWARDLRRKARAVRVHNPVAEKMQPTAFYFKQSSGRRTETGIELDGRRYEAYPFYPSGMTRDEYERQMEALHEKAEARRRASDKRKRSLPVLQPDKAA